MEKLEIADDEVRFRVVGPIKLAPYFVRCIWCGGVAQGWVTFVDESKELVAVCLQCVEDGTPGELVGMTPYGLTKVSKFQGDEA